MNLLSNGWTMDRTSGWMFFPESDASERCGETGRAGTGQARVHLTNAEIAELNNFREAAKPRSREAAKPRSREAAKPRSREAAKPRSPFLSLGLSAPF